MSATTRLLNDYARDLEQHVQRAKEHGPYAMTYLETALAVMAVDMRAIADLYREHDKEAA